MRRSMRRVGTIVTVACAAAFATALPAFAKGEVIPVYVTASVTGPGLATPVAIRWGGDCPFPEYCGSNGSAKGLDGFSFLNSTGVLGRATPSYFGPARSLLGPKYEITYRVVSRGVVMTAHQDLYPFGPGTSQYDPQRPWLYAQPGQRLFTGMLPGGWIQAPTSLVSILRDHGFHVPTPPPTGFPTAPQPQTVAKVPSPKPDGPAPWALGLGALALAVMVVAGAVVGRGRSAKRAMRPAATR